MTFWRIVSAPGQLNAELNFTFRSSGGNAHLLCSRSERNRLGGSQTPHEVLSVGGEPAVSHRISKCLVANGVGGPQGAPGECGGPVGGNEPGRRLQTGGSCVRDGHGEELKGASVAGA